MGMGLVPFYSTLETVKSLTPSNIKGLSKVLYQKPWLKFMARGVYLNITQCISEISGANSV